MLAAVFFWKRSDGLSKLRPYIGIGKSRPAAGPSQFNMPRNNYNKSRWQQDRERFQLNDPDPAPPGSAAPIRQAILEVFSRLESDEHALWRQLEQEWENLAGTPIARHARPTRLERNTLTVAVDSAVWRNELIRYERGPLLARLQERYGADRIKEIRFR